MGYGRKAIGEIRSDSKYIETVPRRGYRLCAGNSMESNPELLLSRALQQSSPPEQESDAQAKGTLASYAAGLGVHRSRRFTLSRHAAISVSSHSRSWTRRQ